MTDRIILLKDSDMISESMKTINYNFKLLENDSAVNEYKWQQYVKSVDRKIGELKSSTDSRENAIAQNLEDIQDLIDSMATREDIQNQINNAIKNADAELQEFLDGVVGQQISHQLGTYATTSYVDGQIGSLDYVRSSAFDDFKSDASRRIASANRIVANSSFAENEEGYLVYKNDTVSPYKKIEEYWDDLNQQERTQIDPQGKGLSDPEVLEAFITLCETKFKTISSELSSIRQSVGPGEASVDIMAAVQDKTTGKQIAAAIFAHANEDGSDILLYADKIQIEANHKLLFHADDLLMSADHRLALVGGQFTVSSDNFTVTKEGDITLNNANLNGKIVAQEFRTPSGNTYMGNDGVLHATNAVIDGQIKANQFGAETSIKVNKTVRINESDHNVKGTLKKTTLIDGQSFNIGVSGKLSNTENGTFDTKNNSLYIKIVDLLPNSGNSRNEDFGQYLYGVPVLCMRYAGTEYMLSPATWFNPNANSTANLSNMRFLDRYSATHCTYNSDFRSTQNTLTTSGLSLGDGVTTTVYLFRNDKTYTGNKSLVTFGINEMVYQFEVLTWLDTTEMSLADQKALLKGGSKPLLDNNDNGVYTLRDTCIGSNGAKYCGQGGVQTAINVDNRNDMIKYLPKENYSLGIQFEINDMYDPGYSSSSSLPDTNGIDHIMEMLWNCLRSDPATTYGKDITGKMNTWQTKAFGNGGGLTHNCSILLGSTTTDATNINKHLPFATDCLDDGNINYKGYDYKVKYYPICDITNYGKVHANGTKQVIANCELYVYGVYSNNGFGLKLHYDDNPNSDHTVAIETGQGQWEVPDIDFTLDRIDLKLEFSAVLTFENGIYTNYTPLNIDTYDNIKDRVVEFLKTYPFNQKVAITNHDTYYNFIKLSGTITGSGARNANGQSFQPPVIELKHA